MQHVPVSFGKHFTVMENQLVMLWVGDRSWPVRLIFHPLNDRFSAGWVAFAKENWLKEGDVCVFFLIDICSKHFQMLIIGHNTFKSLFI